MGQNYVSFIERFQCSPPQKLWLVRCKQAGVGEIQRQTSWVTMPESDPHTGGEGGREGGRVKLRL